MLHDAVFLTVARAAVCLVSLPDLYHIPAKLFHHSQDSPVGIRQPVIYPPELYPLFEFDFFRDDIFFLFHALLFVLVSFVHLFPSLPI